MELAYALGTTDAAILSGEELHSPTTYQVIVNGRVLGVHRCPHRFAADMRGLRRAGLLDQFVSVQVHSHHRCVYIYSDGGRICRPLLLIDQENKPYRPLLKQRHIEEIRNGSRDFPSLITDGLVEFVDVSEVNNCFIAIVQRDIDKRLSKEEQKHSAHEGRVDASRKELENFSIHTHMEIDPMTILGVVSGLIPFPHHNQSPRTRTNVPWESRQLAP